MNAVLISPAMLLASGTNYLPEQSGINYTPPRINLAAVAGILREKARAIFQANTADFANFNENNVPLAVTGMDLVFSKPQAYLKLQFWDETQIFTVVGVFMDDPPQQMSSVKARTKAKGFFGLLSFTTYISHNVPIFPILA